MSLSKNDDFVWYATTDNDVQDATRVEEVSRTKHPIWNVEHLADLPCLGQSQISASNQTADIQFQKKKEKEKVSESRHWLARDDDDRWKQCKKEI